jgi:uncharacterized protein YkwD
MKKPLIIIFLFAFSTFVVLLVKRSYELGVANGYREAVGDSQSQVDDLVEMIRNGATSYKKAPTPTPTPAPAPKKATPAPTWGGPQLWEAVNKRRIELGVNPLSQRDEICTIASIRLNQLLELGKLDGHEGFSKLPDQRPDLKWIYEKYNLTEFLVSGADSPQDAVSLWENTLGHKKLLTGGEYVWGCIYAQNSFAVAITAY